MANLDATPATGVEELLREAAAGHIGVDQRYLKRILDLNDPGGILRFAQHSREQEPGPDSKIDLDPLLGDLFRHYGTSTSAAPNLTASGEAVLDFYLEMIRREPEDIDEGVIQALLPFGARAVPPLLKLYEELGEEQGSDIAFVLAALRVRDPGVLTLLLDRLEYDAADGAFCLGLYGDPAGRNALEKMLTGIPSEEIELRREIEYAIEQLDAPQTQYEPEPFDIYAEYPKVSLPPFDLLVERERLAMLASPEAEIRAGAAHSFFNQELTPGARAALLAVARSDAEASVRGQAWASLGDAIADETADASKLREEITAILRDPSRPVEERGGAAVGLHAVADGEDVRKGLEALYEEGGKGRVKALEAMWRSLWQPYARFFGAHLDLDDPENKDPELLRQALRGAGYFRLTPHIDKIANFFDREEPYDDLREDALFAYALAMPGETTRGRVKGMLRKIDELTALSAAESELVQFALDERLRLHGLAPVFEAERHADHETAAESPSPKPAAPPVPAEKPGRNDPCPCGSGKKFKKCHGA